MVLLRWRSGKSNIKKINKLSLSEDSNSILKVALLTNSFPPKNKIEVNEFNNFKINYLKNNGDLNIIKDFYLKITILIIMKLLLKNI